MRFSKSIKIANSSLAEVLAVKETFLLFSSSQWYSSHALLIESDDINVVHWVLSPCSAPWRMRHIFVQIDNLKASINNWFITHIFREANMEADRLSKDAVHCEQG
ncbi:hypothetical protein PTKIN_Ptkin10aG0142200 [Pterospermum kingtungense]